MSSVSDNQHYVPQFYLRAFTIPGEKSLIWEFDKKHNQFAKTLKSIRTVCSHYRYYRQVRQDGVEEADLLERGFSKELELKAAPLFKKLIVEIAEGKTEVIITPSDYGQLCYCAAIQYTRVPAFRNKIADRMKTRSKQLLSEMVDKQRKEGTLPAVIDELLQKEQTKVIIEDWGTIKTMLEAAVVVSNALMDKSPGFFRSAPGCYFITSDNPVTYWVNNYKKYPEEQLEPINPEAEVYFPMSRDTSMVFFPRKSDYARSRMAIRLKCLDLLSPMVQFINMQTAFMADRFLYSPKNDKGLWEPPRPAESRSQE